MKIHPRFFAPRALLTWLAGTALAAAQTYNVTDLGALSGAPTYATAISESGVIAGYAQPGATSARAWIWKTGFGFTDVGSLGGADNRAMAVGLDGRLYGTSQNGAGVARGFVFDPLTLTLTDLGSPVAGDAVSAVGVNVGGAVVGFTTTGGSTFGFKLAGGTFTLLGALNGADSPATSAAYGINGAGQIVGVGSWVNGGTRAFRTDAGGSLVPLGTLGGNDSTATAINAAGQVVGYSTLAVAVTHAFAYLDGVGMRDLGYLDYYHDSMALGVNDAGDVVGTAFDASGGQHAAAWLGSGAIRDLSALIPPTAGWTLEEATAINNGGDIVGHGLIGGQEHAFLLTRIAGPDTLPPVAVAKAAPPAYAGTATLNVAVKYWDNEKVVTSTVQGVGAIRVRGPNFYDAPGTCTSWTTLDSQTINAGYTVPGPGGTWGPEDNGIYEIYVAANRVSDLAGNKTPGGVIGTFTIAFQTAPTFSIAGLPATTTTGTPVSLTLTATGSYPSNLADVFNYTIDWAGDGSDVQTLSGPTNTVAPHTYAISGAWTVRVHCTDPHGVPSPEVTAAIKVTQGTALLPAAQVLATTVSQVGIGGTVAAVNGSRMYFFGPPFDVNTNTTVATWDYLTPGSAFTLAGAIGGDNQLYAGAAVDSRNRTIIFGGSNGDGVTAGTQSFPTNGSVAALPVAITSSSTTRDNLGRVYVYSSYDGSLYRYTAGVSGAGSWETLPGAPVTGAAGISFDGVDRIIVFTAQPAAYSILGNAWSQTFTSPSAFSRAARGADGLVYLVGASQLWTFDPVRNTIAQAGMTTYNEAGGLALLGTDGWLYLIGGNGTNIERFDTRPSVTSAPVISSAPVTTLVQGTPATSPWIYLIAASGKPRPTYSLDHGPAGMTVDSNTGIVIWTPTPAQVGVQTAVVRATNSAGSVGQSIVFNVRSQLYSDTTPPTPPTNVVVSNVTATTADISWTAGTDDVGVVGYRLIRKTVLHSPKGSGSTTYYSVIGFVSGTSLHLSGLKPYTSFPYYLVSVDAAGNQSGYAAAGFSTTYMSTPGITNGNNGPGAGKFAIVGEAFTSYTFTGTGLPAATLAAVSAPTGAVWVSPAGTSGYFTWTPAAGQEGGATFTLSGTNSSGSVAQSYTVHVYPAGTDLLAPSTPGSFVVDQVSWNGCRATWTASTDNHAVTGYHLTATHLDSRLHAPPYHDQTVTADVAASVLQTNITGLTANTGYIITVQARDAAGNLSNPAVAPVATPPQPFVLAASNLATVPHADGSTTLAWPGYGYYWKFTVQSSTDLVTWLPVEPAAQWPSYVTTFTFTPNPAGPNRFYRVLATPGL